MDAAQCSLSRGTVRTGEEHLKKLYTRLNRQIDRAEALEPAFSLSCLLKDKPTEENAAREILRRTGSTENGDFEGNTEEQIAIARAGLAMADYTADRNMLKRLAEWCRWLETEWESMEDEFCIRVQAADLMEFLVRFYRTSGIKALLRLCTRLRFTSMDWTSYLHNERRRETTHIQDQEEAERFFHGPVGKEIDYFQLQFYLNHAELAADGMRFCAWSAMFSGNSRDFSAGKTGWEQLSKDHRAACGGTSGNPFMSGSSPSSPVSGCTAAAWTEAMITQANLCTDPWALNEAVIIVHNALAEAIYRGNDTTIQRVNDPLDHRDNGGKEELFRQDCRLARAAASAWHHAVTATKEGFRINYFLKGRYCLKGGDKPILLEMTEDSALLRGNDGNGTKINLFLAGTENCIPVITCGKKKQAISIPEGQPCGITVHLEKEWKVGEGIRMTEGNTPVLRDSHHQGICCYHRNRLMAMSIAENEYAFAATSAPEIRDGRILMTVRKTGAWKERNGIPTDIPVKPRAEGETETRELIPYAGSRRRIAVFPTAADYV